MGNKSSIPRNDELSGVWAHIAEIRDDLVDRQGSINRIFRELTRINEDMQALAEKLEEHIDERRRTARATGILDSHVVDTGVDDQKRNPA